MTTSKDKTGSKNGHLKGWQWRESKRALEKKERAKARGFMSAKAGKITDVATVSFRIPIERLESRKPGIVSSISRGGIRVIYENTYLDCMIGQGLPRELVATLAVGDKVTVQIVGDKYFVDHVLERETILSRLRKDSTRWSEGAKDEHLIAANVDIAIIVVSAQNPPLHAKFIDRYLILIQYGKIEPIICVNKADLGSIDEELLLVYENMGIRTIRTSTKDGSGIEELKSLMEGKVSVLVGNSGVGKSSLINSIVPGFSLKVSSVSEKTGKGRHTTTASGLVIWNDNSFIIDTPGVRSLGIGGIKKQDLQLYFPEIMEYSEHCKFPDCLHDTEQDCGIKTALANRQISNDRYDSYLKILGEI